MKGIWREIAFVIGSGAVIGGVAFVLQGSDFEKALAPPEEASSAELEAMLDGEIPPDAVNSGEIPVPKMVSFLDVASRFFGQPGVHFIDARDIGSYEAGHIPGAILMDAEKLDSDPLFDQDKIEKLPRKDVLIVYCSGGQCDLSRRLGTNLVTRGFTNVLVYEGGWNEWTEEGQPTEEGLEGGSP